MDMKSNSKSKNLIGEDETPHEKETPSSPQSLQMFLEKMGVDWEQKGRAVYIYPDSMDTVKKLLEKMPNPEHDQYIIIPLGQSQGYTVFIMSTTRNISIRIGYGRNSIPYSSHLSAMIGKIDKVAKEIGIKSIKNAKNLIEA